MTPAPDHGQEGDRAGIDLVAICKGHVLLGQMLGGESKGERWRIPETNLMGTEDLLEAAKRCLFQTTGWRAEGDGCIDGPGWGPGQKRIVVLLELSRDVDPRSALDKKEWNWFPLCSLPDGLNAAAKHGISCAIKHVESQVGRFFDRTFLRTTTSSSMAKLNRQVLGIDLGQYSFLSAAEIDRLLQRLAAETPAAAPGDPILELGAGCGGLAFEIATRLHIGVVALDPSAAALTCLALTANARGVTQVRGIRSSANRLADLDEGTALSDERFAAAVGSDFTYFVADFAACAVETFRVLRPGGSFVFYAICPSTEKSIADSLVCGPFMATPARLKKALTMAGFRDLVTEDCTPGFAGVVENYLRFTLANRMALDEELGKDVVTQSLEEFEVEKTLLARGELVRLLFSGRKPT